MKIIHVVPFIGDEASGPAYSVPALCRALSKKGCNITLYVLGPISETSFSFEVKTFHRKKFPNYSFGRSPEMYMGLLEEAEHADIIHNHSLWMAPNIYAGMVAKRLNIPLINAPRGTLSDEALSHSAWKKKVAMFLGQKKALLSTSVFHATAEHEANQIHKLFPLTNVAILPNGIDVPCSFHNNIKLQKVLFLGRIHPIKGLENLIYAWKKIESQFLGWELDIIGTGDLGYINSLRKLISYLDCKRINMRGPVFGEEKQQIYSSVSLYVLPSYSENFAMTVAEALSAGTPVITTDQTPWIELENRNSGWCVKVGIEPLQMALESALKTPEKLHQMGINGRIWMQKEFSWEKIASDTINTYNWILTSGEKPSWII